MAKKPSAKPRQPFAIPNEPPAKSPPGTGATKGTPWLSYRNYLRLIFVLIVFGGGYLALQLQNMYAEVPHYTYKLIAKFDKDPRAFTQGLLFDDAGEFLYESTGLLGESSIRKIDWKTGKPLINLPLDPSYFGEGLTLFQDRFFQLTWRNEVILEYDRDLKLTKTHDVSGETWGRELWGLTTDGQHLIISNGTSQLIFVDPATMQKVKSVTVRHGNATARDLNELEFANGMIYANRYQTDLIYEIDAKSYEVKALIDLQGLWPDQERPQGGVLNGIAVHRPLKNLFVTGKLCPALYQIELQLKK